MRQEKRLRWIFVYGPGRSGTSYISRVLASRSLKLVFDWGLGPIINGAAKNPYLDRSKLLSDLSENILQSAKVGGGKSIDLLYKQANTSLTEFRTLEEMFGQTDRTLFCLREPSGYMASAIKKFSHVPIARLQETYLHSLKLYDQIGGDLIEYGPRLDAQKIHQYLLDAQLDVNDKTLNELKKYRFSGEESNDLVTSEMQKKYLSLTDTLRRRSSTFDAYSFCIEAP